MNGRYGGGRAVATADRWTTSRGAIAARTVVTILGVGLIAAACTSSGGGPKSIGPASSTTSTAATTSTSSTTTPVPATTGVDATKAAILAAYRAAWADIDAVDAHYPIDVSDPRLSNHMAGDELERVRSFSTRLKLQHQYLAGPPIDTSGAIVKDLVRTVAVVSDCNVDRSILMNGGTHQVLKSGSTERTLVNAKIELIAGTWKMTEFSNVDVTCLVAH